VIHINGKAFPMAKSPRQLRVEIKIKLPSLFPAFWGEFPDGKAIES
jgi:hypothetical protein